MDFAKLLVTSYSELQIPICMAHTQTKAGELEDGENERGGLVSFGSSRPQAVSPVHPQSTSELATPYVGEIQAGTRSLAGVRGPVSLGDSLG